jgi:cleavage and polyadenylation specificity factor subunit 1
MADDEDQEDQDPIKQILFTLVGANAPRPHLLALHVSGRLNVYEALPRYTLDTASQSRRSLAVRFKKVYNQSLPIPATSKLPYTLIPFSDIEKQTGVFITGERPHWILSSDAHPLKAYGLKQSAVAFARTTHLGGMGEYFIKIEDVSQDLIVI